MIEKKAQEKQASPRRFVNVPGPGGGGGAFYKQVRPSSPPSNPFVHAKSKANEKRVKSKYRRERIVLSPSSKSSQSPRSSAER